MTIIGNAIYADPDLWALTHVYPTINITTQRARIFVSFITTMNKRLHIYSGS